MVLAYRQLLSLEELAQQSNLTLQIVPFTRTRHPGGDGPLEVIEYADKSSIWFTEGAKAGRLSNDKRQVMRSMDILNQIRVAALTPVESTELIRQVREARYEQRVA